MGSNESGPRKFKSIQDIYNKAEQHIKQVELCQTELPFGAINELRYAGHHLLKGLAAQEAGNAEKAEREYQDAEDHCNRAMYEASEAGIGYLVWLYRTFEEDYKDIPLTGVIPEYVRSRALIQEIVRKLSEGRLNRVSSSDQASEYMEMFASLYKMVNVLEAARPELNKAKLKQVCSDRRYFIGVGIGVVGVIIALIRILVF